MAPAQLYAIALERSTQPDLPTEHNEVLHGMTRLSDTDRAACEGWIQEMNFLRPGEEDDEEIWGKIKKNWIGYLSATSPMPDAALAPNRKVVWFRSGDEDEDGNEDAGEQKCRFAQDRRRRMIIQSAFWNGLDMIEAMAERWPRAARAALYSMDTEGEGEERGASESLAAVYDLGRQGRYQAIWTSLVGFIPQSHDEGTLEEMGMRLSEC